MRTVAIDYETYYDDECSVKELGPVNYVLHPDFDCYLVAMVTDDGEEFVGHPSNAPWEWLKDSRAVAHNALFEECVTDWLVSSEIIPPDCLPYEWQDTMDLAFYCGLCGGKSTRGLAKIMKAVYDVELDKGVRVAIKGVSGSELKDNPVVRQYCLEDAMSCMLLWRDYGHRWPEKERELARLTRHATKRGVSVSTEKLEEAIKTLKSKCEESLDYMPWYPERKAMSIPAYKDTCEEFGLKVPKSTAQDNPDFIRFCEKNKEEYPWVTAITDLRRANKMEKNLTKMLKFTSAYERMHIGVSYHGAHTGRWAGEEVNLQGLNKEELFGIKMRETIEAPEGKVYAILDYAQIEPRTLMWLVGDEAFLDMVGTGMSPYEAHARLTMGWKGGKLKEEDPGLYAFAKMRFIALGYGMGWKKFYDRAKTNPDFLKLGIEVSEQEAKQTVQEYRETNWRVPDFWKRLEATVESLVGNRHGYLRLVSGRPLNYYHIRTVPTEKWGRMVDQLYVSTWVGDKKGRPTWGGEITENCLAEGTRVLTSQGAVPIEEVTIDHKIWDGIEWVSSEGAVFNGEQEVYECNGFKATGDHLIHDGNSWTKLTDLDGSAQRRSLKLGRDSVLSLLREETTRELEHYAIVGTPWSSALGSFEGERARAVRAETKRKANANFLDSFRLLNYPLYGATDTPASCLGATMKGVLRTRIMGEEVSKCLSRGGLIGSLSSTMPQLSKVGTSPDSISTESTTTEITSPVTLDLLNEALIHGIEGTVLPWSGEEIASRILSLSRDSVHCGVETLYATISTWVELPRKLCPITKNTRKEKVYDVVNCGPRNRFVVVNEQGALIVHNCVQATDRDVMGEAILRVHKEKGLVPEFTAHDEVVYEIDAKGADKEIEEINEIMTVVPEWAKGLPLETEYFLSKVYTK